jgi:hypothetical protein
VSVPSPRSVVMNVALRALALGALLADGEDPGLDVS